MIIIYRLNLFVCVMRQLLIWGFLSRLIIFIFFLSLIIVRLILLVIFFFLEIFVFFLVFTLTFCFLTKSFVFVYPFEYTINLLLKQGFKFFNHEVVDWTALNEVGHETVNCVAFINNNALESKVCDININIKFWLTIVFNIYKFILILVIISDCLLVSIIDFPCGIFWGLFGNGGYCLLFQPFRFCLLFWNRLRRNVVTETLLLLLSIKEGKWSFSGRSICRRDIRFSLDCRGFTKTGFKLTFDLLLNQSEALVFHHCDFLTVFFLLNNSESVFDCCFTSLVLLSTCLHPFKKFLRSFDLR
jgi:hypothetical protein